MINSIVVAMGATGFGLLIGLPAAYSISKFRQKKLATIILTARMAPGIAFLVPWFILFLKVKMIDTYFAIILTHLILVLPLIIWIMVGFFEDFPNELEDAAMIDGCSTLLCFLKIVLPIVTPGIVTAAILSIIFSWNNFMFSLVISGDTTRTLPVAVFNFISWDSLNWGGLSAAATVVTLPVLIVSLIVQRYIVKGLTFGAIKG
jgi:multiple sugar transport system permease protein